MNKSLKEKKMACFTEADDTDNHQAIKILNLTMKERNECSFTAFTPLAKHAFITSSLLL